MGLLALRLAFRGYLLYLEKFKSIHHDDHLSVVLLQQLALHLIFWGILHNLFSLHIHEQGEKKRAVERFVFKVVC